MKTKYINPFLFPYFFLPYHNTRCLPLPPLNQQLFGDNNDVFQQYGIPMNPTDNTAIPPGLDDRQRQQLQQQQQNADGSSNTGGGAQQNSITGNELISYQPGHQPIDFTDFLNIDENDLALNASGSFVTNK